MGLFEDIAGVVGNSCETTHVLPNQGTIPVALASGPVGVLSDVRDLLPLGLTHNEIDVALVNGQSVSLYGLETELTWVYLFEDPSVGPWVHAFKYANMSGYTDGSALQTPAPELRV